MVPLLLRRIAGALVASVLAVTVVFAGAGAAHAEDGYRYWNYSHLTGDTFEFAQSGPADFVPEDGAVEGWRFGTSTVAQGIEPRADLGTVSFDAVCGDSKAAAGEKRVAVLVDFGTDADADAATIPDARGECAVVPTDANGQKTLESVVDVRGDKGMICALDGYPVKGCGDPVGDATVQADEATVDFTLPSAEASSDTADDAADDSGDGVSWPLIVVIGAVVVLGGVAVPLYRRNRES